MQPNPFRMSLPMEHHMLPKIFPEPLKACDWGREQYGLRMAFLYKGVRQALRWIMPGEFVMGSFEFEQERFDDEEQHKVILTQGFWLRV